MFYLTLASLIFGFSFGLIKGKLDGIDPYLVAWVRLALSFIVFLPFMRLSHISRGLRLKLFGIGMLQYGVMYLAYIDAFRYLQSYEVALFTIFTPLYVTLFDAAIERRCHKRAILAALLALFATAVMLAHTTHFTAACTGFLLVQISNGAFALGQLWYVKVLADHRKIKDEQLSALLYGGAVVVSGLASLCFTQWRQVTLTMAQVGTLLYLGVIASACGFWLWNKGARLTKVASLAVMNNLKIPLAVLLSIFLFGEEASLEKVVRLGVSFCLMLLALRISHKTPT